MPDVCKTCKGDGFLIVPAGTVLLISGSTLAIEAKAFPCPRRCGQFLDGLG